MNRNYKVIWNASLNCFMAVAEYAKARGKSSKSSVTSNATINTTDNLSSTSAFRLTAIGIGLIAAGFTMSPQAFAVTGVGKGVTIGTATTDCTTPASAGGTSSVAVGCGSVADTSNTAITFYDRVNPYNTTVDTTTGRYYSVAVGTNARAIEGGTSVGMYAESRELGVALGAQAKSRNVAAVAIGPAALATGNTSLALGRQSAATADFAQAIGNVSAATGIGSLAMGHSATATGSRSIAIGAADIGSAGSTGDQAGVLYQTVQRTYSTGKDSIALGAAANSTKDYALAIGASSKANGINSTAIGFNSEATGISSFAIGAQSKALANNALALGGSAEADKVNSIAVGVGAKANYINSVALGANSQVLHDNSAAIGDGSTTNAYSQQAFLYGTGVAGGLATGAVSVGKGTGTATTSSNERRLQNVAAGALDTDGVNVSQLKRLKVITDKTGGDIANILGGGSTFNSATGAVTSPAYNINNTNYNNVGAALKATKTEVVKGTNVKSVDETFGANNQSIYTVNANGTTASAGSGAVKVTPSAPVNNVTDYKFDLSDITKNTISNNTTNIGNNTIAINRGLDFTGDNSAVTINRKSGEKLTVKGGATAFATGNNIGVVADNSANANTLTVRLAKDLIGLDSATFGGVSISTNGLNNGGKQITNLASAGSLTDINNAKNAVNVSDLNAFGSGIGKVNVVAGTNVSSVNPVVTGNLTTYTVNANGTTASGSAAVTVTPSGPVNNVTDYKVDLSAKSKKSLDDADSAMQTLITQVDGVADKTLTKADNKANFASGKNILLTRETDGSIKVATKDDVEFKKVTVKDGTNSSVVEATKVTIGGTNQVTVSGVTGTVNGLTNKTWNGTTIVSGQAATEDQLQLASGALVTKGMNFVGNDGQVINRMLGQTLGIEGGMTTGASSAANIKTVKKDSGALEIQLAKNLTDLDSITINNGGPVFSSTGINMGSNVDINGKPANRITNLGKGVAGTDAVNIDQLNEVNDTANKGWFVRTDSGDGAQSNVKPNDVVNIKGDSKSISVTNVGNDLIVALGDDLSVGTVGNPGSDGKDGFIGVNGKDGVSSVAINGANGTIGLTGPTGTSGIIGVVNGVPGVNGGDGITRIVIDDIQVATMEDGLKFAGNTGATINKKLNQTLSIEGKLAATTEASGANLRVDSKDGKLNLVMAKNLTDLDSITINNGGPVFSSAGINMGSNVDINGYPTNRITNLGKGIAGTDAVNVEQLNEVKESAADANKGWNLSAQSDVETISTVKPSDTVDLKNTDNNITVSKTAESNKVTFNLSKDIVIDSVKTGDSTINDSGLTIAGGPKFTKTAIDTAGNKITNVANGIVDVGSKDAVNGGQLFEVFASVQTQTAAIALEMGAGLDFNADSGPVINKKAGSAPLTLKGGNNITTTAEDGSIKFDLNGNINVESVTTGNTIVSTNGVTIKNGPSMTAAGIYAGNGETAPSMTAAGINAAGNKVTNVADGMAPRDAVNFGQLDAVSRSLGNSINELGYKIGEVEDDANAGISAAMAMSSLPQAYIIGKSMIGGGIATYNGESAVAIGFSKLSDDGRWVMKLNGTADTQGNVGAAIGAGFHFD